jgi:ATP-dependent DNA helicase 2 subunit 1
MLVVSCRVYTDDAQDYLRSKSQPVSGKKVDLVERVSDYLSKHT